MRTVLLVDDDEALREALGEALEEEGFAVAKAQNGRDAMRWLRDRGGASCVIVLDVMMPVMDGNDFLLAKRADLTIVGLPVVVVTASAGALLVDRAPDVKAFLSKPIEMDLLLAALTAAAPA